MATNYGMIYCSVNESGRPLRPEDMHVAKKMAVLIATDFVCWAPAILFGNETSLIWQYHRMFIIRLSFILGLTAALHLPLISISVAKIFLVLFYPINACFNPFLYVFFSKVIKTDMKNIVDSAIFSWWTHQGSNGGGGTVDKSNR
jgi:follicle stimulating hormone receptor